jgi:hypothetical protein
LGTSPPDGCHAERKQGAVGNVYDHHQQLAVDTSGTPLITMGPPTANTTSSVDGEDPPSSEDWYNDFHPDEPFQL